MARLPFPPFAAVLLATVLAVATPVRAGDARHAEGGTDLPTCPAAGVDAAPAAPPPGPPAVDDPRACLAVPTRIESVRRGELPVPRPAYHHLGVTTRGEWTGVVGRLAVRDPAVRSGTFDFVATRFLAKRPRGGDGGHAWLEVGWAETGWSGGGAQRVYTFDSEAMAWVFFDEYPLRAGDRVWVELVADPDGTWRAWLWWGQRWRLLAEAGGRSEAGPSAANGLRGPARLEQYVEVHRDRAGSGGTIAVPPIEVDRVRVTGADPDAPPVPWRPPRVPTTSPGGRSPYCLHWTQAYDTWSAGDCTGA